MTADAPITIPHDHLGQPDLQELVRQCGGYDKITPGALGGMGSRQCGMASAAARRP
jgi:hypothetical protein